MPGKLRRNDYDLVEEAYDNKSPVHSEDAFEHGISFKVKYIGTKEIHKPSSRAEIVTAMRRIRYEYKMYGTRKERTELSIAVSGVKVVRKEEAKRTWISQKKKDFVETEVMRHPINRIFYVSHDSQDLQIFSFIAKEDDIFRCSVFKASNKADAVRIVRTVGQAFEVCHRRTLSQQEEVQEKTDMDGKKLDIPMETEVPPPEGQMDLSADLAWADKDQQLVSDPGIAPLTIQQLRQIYQQQLDHQRQETQAALTQVKLLTHQLNGEAEARQDLQNQLEQALKQNKDLISTIQQLVNQIQTLQVQSRGRGDSGVSLSLDADGKIPSVTSRSSQAPSLSSAGTTPVKGVMTSTTPSSKLRHLGDPVFPNIPPPATTPSPVMSHRSDTDAFDGSFSSLQSGTYSKAASSDSFLRNTSAPESSPLPTLVDLSSSDLEMVEPRQEPFPQQFLQFVFDNNSAASESGKVTPVSNSSLQQNSGATSANKSLAERKSGKSPILNGTF